MPFTPFDPSAGLVRGAAMGVLLEQRRDFGRLTDRQGEVVITALIEVANEHQLDLWAAGVALYRLVPEGDLPGTALARLQTYIEHRRAIRGEQ